MEVPLKLDIFLYKDTLYYLVVCIQLWLGFVILKNINKLFWNNGGNIHLLSVTQLKSSAI